MFAKVYVCRVFNRAGGASWHRYEAEGAHVLLELVRWALLIKARGADIAGKWAEGCFPHCNKGHIGDNPQVGFLLALCAHWCVCVCVCVCLLIETLLLTGSD